MVKLKTPVAVAVVGAMIGYFVLSPYAMYISHLVHMKIPIHEMSVLDVFKPGVLLWSLSFATFGGAIGLAVGILYQSVKERTKRIKEAKEYTDLVLDSISDGMVAIDRDHRIVSANRAFLETTGYSLDEVIGKHCYEVSHGTKEPCSLPEHQCPFEEVIETGEPSTAVHTHFDRDGNKIYVELTASPVRDEDGNITEIIEMSKDITERKLAEEELFQKEHYYRSLLFNLHEDIVVIDENYKITDLNNTALVTTGKKREDIIGKPCYEVSHEYDGPCDLHGEDCKLKEVFETRREANCHHVHKHKDGSDVHVDILLSPLMDERGKVTHVIEAVRDITDVMKAQEALQNAYEELKSLDELKSNVIANVTHELRTPITIVKGALEIAMEEESMDDAQEYLKIALKAMARQDHIVGDLIDTTQLKDEGRLRLEPVNIGEVVALVIEDARSKALEDNIKIKLDLEKDLPPVKSNFERLSHALENLIDNAIKFSGENGEITIAARNTGSAVEVCVKDNGIGIPEDQLDAIFEPLYQIDSSATRKFGGTGMGLAVVKRIIEGHGGKITVESTPQKGSTFCFTLKTAK